jgi:hypothetical protein
MLYRLALISLVSLLLGLLLRHSDALEQRHLWARPWVAAPRSVSSSDDDPVKGERERAYQTSGAPQIQGDIQDSTSAKVASTRLREGREVRDPQATFQLSGERLNCVLPSLQTTVTVLENLTLERAFEIMTQHDETATWEVEGLITEYQGRNYLLLRRAVVNSISLNEQ